MPRSGELMPAEGKQGIFYGVSRCTGKTDGTFEYLAATEVDSPDNLPEGMAGCESPEQTYAVFAGNCRADLIAAHTRAYSEGLPQSREWQCADGPMFELYPATFDSEQSTLYLYVAVKPKALEFAFPSLM